MQLISSRKIGLYTASFFFISFMIQACCLLCYFKAALQAQTVVSDVEEKEKTMKMDVSLSVLSCVALTLRLVVNVLLD